MTGALPCSWNMVLEIIELAPARYAGIGRLFGPGYPNLAFVHGVIERRLPGRVWVVPSEQGFSACLIATNARFCFATGALEQDVLDEMLALLAAKRPCTLVLPPGLDAGAAAARHGFVEGERIQFGAVPGEDPGCQDIEPPRPFELVEIDAELFRASNWRPAVHGIFVSTEHYLENHYGFGLLRDGKLISEAHGVVGGGLVEIGSYTLEEYRRMGLSNVVCAAVLKHGARLGHRTITTCDVERAASIAISRRIGLREELRYRVVNLQS